MGLKHNARYYPGACEKKGIRDSFHFVTNINTKTQTMKTKANVQLSLYEIIHNNGKIEQFIWNGPQYAGFKRRKGIKKEILSIKKIATISVQIKTAL